MTATRTTASNTGQTAQRGFSLAELLVVIGILSLLTAITLPPLQLARRKAMQATCSAQLQQLGRALEGARSETGFYPLWDDAGRPLRYTWIDVLVQRRLLGPADSTDQTEKARSRSAARLGYCPADRRPDALNATRHQDLVYPSTRAHGGIDYSYGIGVPLSAGGWAWRPTRADNDERPPRRFRDHQHHTAGRVLAADAYASAIYNLSGRAIASGIWNDPTQFDNTVAWGRHLTGSLDASAANLLFQDGHVSTVEYARSRTAPVNTTQTFVWYPGEPLDVGPSHRYDGNAYPNEPPPGFGSGGSASIFPPEMTPSWYTQMQRWTLITHK